MSAFNPFRARNADGGSKQDGSTTPQPPINLPPDLFTKPIQPLSSQLPNGHPRKPALSLEIEDQDSSSSSSDEQTADPFNPDSSVSDNEDDDHHNERLRSFASPTDHSRDTVGSAPHPAPSEDGSTATSPLKSLSAQVSTTEVEGTNISQSTTPAVAPSAGYKSPESEGNTNSSSRADRDKKPPPPPRSHHGKRINASGSRSTSRPESSRSTKRLSFHASSPESVTSVQPPGASNDNAAASPTLPPAPRPTSDYFLTASDSQQTTSSTDSLQRSHSQSKRPPTPPLSRRHSQMRRSKSTQSKSSNSRLTMSSLDSESNDSSQPPSPGPSTRSVASSMSQDRKRVSMPPPASGEIRAATSVSAAALPATGVPADSLSPPPSSRPTLSQPNRRASSYGSPGTGSSSGGPPPPPPPRRARDSNTRNSDGGADVQANRTEAPLPQPSNANDILADLSRLQKEVDDLRGHYENRKVSQ